MAPKTWNQTANNLSWATSTNWTPTGVPTNTDNLSISGAVVAGPYNINLPNSGTTFADISVPLSSPNSIALSSPVPGLSCITTYPAGAFVDVKNAGQYIVLQQGFTGTTPLAKRGPGIVYFSAQASSVAPSTGWTGGLNIEEGTVRVSQANNRLGSGPVVMSGGTALIADGATRSVQNSFTLLGNATFGEASGQTLTITGSSFDLPAVTPTLTVASGLTIQSAITGTAGFTKAGAGTLTITGASPGLSGTVAVSTGAYAGRLQLFGTSTTQLPFPNVTAYDINNSGMLFYDSNIAGGGNYTETASFVGASSGSVPCLIKGTLTFDPAVAGGISGARYTTFACDADLTHPSTTLVFKELPNLDAPPLPVINSGLNFEIYPSGATSMSPKITIDSVAGGTTNSVMTVGPYAATGTGTYIATLEVNNTAPVTFANTIRKNSSVSTNSVTLRFAGTNPEVTVSGQITELTTPGLILNKAGTGKWILSGANTYTGTTSISAGTLSAQSAGAFGTSGAVTQTGGTLDVSGNTALTKTGASLTLVSAAGANALTTTTGTNTLACAGITLSSTIIVDAAAGASLTVNNTAAMSGAFGITKNNSGEIGLGTFANTYTGAVTVAAGTLTVGNLQNTSTASSLGTGALSSAIALTGTLKYNGTGHSTNRSLTFTGSAPVLDASGSGAVTYSTATQAAGARTITFTGSSTAANTLSAALSDGTGAVSVAKSGAGKWVLSNATLNYTGTTSCAGGTLNLGSTNRTLSGALSISDGTIENSTNTISANTTMTGGTITAELTGNKTLDVNSGAAATLQPTNNANTFSGATTVAAGGILRLITAANPTTAGAGQVLGTSAVSVSGDIKTSATGAQRGQMRYGGNLTFNAGAKLYVGGA